MIDTIIGGQICRNAQDTLLLQLAQLFRPGTVVRDDRSLLSVQALRQMQAYTPSCSGNQHGVYETVSARHPTPDARLLVAGWPGIRTSGSTVRFKIIVWCHIFG